MHIDSSLTSHSLGKVDFALRLTEQLIVVHFPSIKILLPTGRISLLISLIH